MALSALAAATVVTAQERKAYRYVDEQGRVVYSQTPPAGKSAKQVDIAPAYRGSGGNTSPLQYDDPRRYSTMGDDRYAQSVREQQRKAEEAKLQRIAELEAECVRNRGVDCKNPETLRLIESNRIPGGRRF
jgi:hypothetical protein